MNYLRIKNLIFIFFIVLQLTGNLGTVFAQKVEPNPEDSILPDSKPDTKLPEKSRTTTEEYNRSMTFLAGGGIGFGIFSPSDVNEYIEDQLPSNAIIVEGFTEKMLFFYSPKFSLNFAPIEHVQIQALLELGWGPKMVEVKGGDTEFYNFVRLSPGLAVNVHIPMQRKRNSLFFGAGVTYHWMSLKDFDADTLGFRGQAGYRIYLRSGKAIEVFGAFDYAKAGTGKEMNDDGKEMTLNFSGIQFGVIFYFISI